MGGNRRTRFRTYFNLFITMVIGGLWHGASLRFIIWGAIHGVGLIFHKFIISNISFFNVMNNRLSFLKNFLSIIITFNFICFAWIFFRAESLENVGHILSQIFFNFHPELIPDIIIGYSATFMLIAGGYLLHFLPSGMNIFFQKRLQNSSIVMQSLIVVIMIFIVYQFKSAEIQPFIYFRF